MTATRTTSNRPVGDLGFVVVGDWTYSAVRATYNGDVYYQPHPFRDDWHYTAATFADREVDAHDAWCDTGFVEDACPACARECVPDLSREDD